MRGNGLTIIAALFYTDMNMRQSVVGSSLTRNCSTKIIV